MRATRRHHWLKRHLEGYLFLLPNLLGFLVFTLFPVLFAFLLGFLSWDLLTPPTFVGLGNYAKLLQDRVFIRALLNTAYYVFVSVPLGVCVSLILALAMNKKLRGIVFFRTLYFMPVVSSSVAVALIWRWLYNPDFGLVNYCLRLIGIPGPNWLTDSQWAMPAVIITSVWKNMGYNMVIFLAGLQGIPQEFYEAAEIDGAGSWGRFRWVTLPLLTPTTFFVLITSLIGSFQVFDSVMVMTEGGPGNATNTIVLYIYNAAFQWFKMGYAAAMGWVLFLIIFVATLVQVKMQSRWVHYDV